MNTNKIIDHIKSSTEIHKYEEVYYQNLKINIAGAWSSLHHIIEASSVLKNCKKVIDIGSGTGKFCLIAAKLNPDTHFVGIELNEKYWAEAIRLKDILGISNVDFILTNYKNVDITKYDGIYIFNPFVMSESDPCGIKFQTGQKQDKEYFEYVNKFKKDLFLVKPNTKLVMNNPFCSIPKKSGVFFNKNIGYNTRLYKKTWLRVQN
jgi:SAM-dependent methyltransferase